ncbi:hypothetical protein CR513_33698, partial [Mucuna pruriens]
MISTPLPVGYIEEDEEALETSFQSLEVASSMTTRLESPSPSKAEVMATRVLTKGGYLPSKGLGPYLSGIATPISIQENPGKAELGYQGGNNEGQFHQRPLIKATLDQYFVKGSIAMIEDEPPSQHEWVYTTDKEPTNWTVEVLPDQYFLKITNKEFPQDGNTIFMCEDPSQPDKPVKDEHVEAKALVEMERWIGQEKPKFQPLTKELEGINLGDEMLSLIGLLKEYVDVFAWSY